MIIGGNLGYRMLRWIRPPERMKVNKPASEFRTSSKLASYWGPQIWDEFVGKTVMDFGCGTGKEAIEIAKHAPRHVIGIDILERDLQTARERAEKEGVAPLCTFSTTPTARADVILTTDAFEHFADPAQVLQIMSTLLNPDGRVFVTFGP